MRTIARNIAREIREIHFPPLRSKGGKSILEKRSLKFFGDGMAFVLETSWAESHGITSSDVPEVLPGVAMSLKWFVTEHVGYYIFDSTLFAKISGVPSSGSWQIG